MKKEIAILGILLFVVATVFISGCIQQQETVTRYVCPDRITIVSDTSECPEPIPSSETETEQTIDYYEEDLDHLGARGNEEAGFGEGWIDSEDCKESEDIKDKGYTNCEIFQVQILTGSDPNPLKVNTGGAIFNNDPIFKVYCRCYK